MFGWLFGSISEVKAKAEPESLIFLRGLASQEKPRFSYFDHVCRIEVTMTYSAVSVELMYDYNRKEWRLDIRDRNTHEALYGYYCTFSAPPQATVKFLLETYDLWEHYAKVIEVNEARMKVWKKEQAETAPQRKAEEEEKLRKARQLKDKYLNIGLKENAEKEKDDTCRRS